MGDKMREEFEEWLESQYGFKLVKEKSGHYSIPEANDMLLAWQASRAAMVREGNQVSAEDVASLQRYGLAGYYDQIGNYCGDEIAQDDESEYILLSDALALFEKP